MMRRLILFLLIFSFRPAFACDCEMTGVTMESISAYELIFVGKVVAISGCDKNAKANFQVEKLFRGKCFASTDIEFDCSSDCQMSFVPGQTWIIYAKYKKYGQAEVHFCSHSRQQFQAEEKDYNTSVHGMTYSEELSWLEKNLGEQKLNEKDIESEQHHENLRPEGYAFFWYYGFGLLGLIAIYFITKKFLK